MIKFNLDKAIEDIANQLETTYKRATDTGYIKEYLLPNVEESKLLEIGFIYKGNTDYMQSPLYEYENLLAIFDDQILHICQVGD